MYRLNAFVKVKEGKKEEVLAAARRLTSASQKQEGCVAYDIFESATRDDVLMFCETWKNQEALDKHAESTVFIEEFARIQSLADVKLEKFTFPS